MIWEATIVSTKVDNKGNDKEQKRKYLIENISTFGEVENILHNQFGDEIGFDVCAIKISTLKEIVNASSDYEEKIFFATIVDYFIDDNDNKKEIKYVVALWAKDINEAHKVALEYMKQGLQDMELVGLRCTKFEDVLR